MKVNSHDVIRGPSACFRSHIRTRCSICGEQSERTHSPLRQRGVFCAAHCPECSQAAAVDVDAVAAALTLVDD